MEVRIKQNYVSRHFRFKMADFEKCYKVRASNDCYIKIKVNSPILSLTNPVSIHMEVFFPFTKHWLPWPKYM